MSRRSTRFVTHQGRVYPRDLFTALGPMKRGVCPRCEGTGELIQTWDEEHYDIVVPCDTCRKHCPRCGKWVAKTGHVCQGAADSPDASGGSMICPTCKNYYRDTQLQCPICLARQSHQSYVAFQKQFLPQILAGESKLSTTRTKSGRWHIVLIGDPAHGWCGEKLAPRLGAGSLDPRQLTLICPDCREVFEAMVKQLPRPEVA